MKKLILIVGPAMISCGPQTRYQLDQKAPVVDYHQSYDYYHAARNLSETKKKV